MFTDIRHKNWIEKLPEAAQPYAYLVRADRPIGSWLLFWPGAWAIVLAAVYPEMTGGVLLTLLLFAIGAPVMRGAGCTINDLWDRDLDKQVERTAARPIASGQIPVKHAIIFLGVLFFIGLLILLQLTLPAVLLGFAAIPFVILYPLMKRFTFWPQAFLGLTFNFGALIGWAAIDVTIAYAAVIVYIAGFFWTLAYDTIYAFQDIEDDLTIGVKSTAILFQDDPKPIISFFYAMLIIMTGYALIEVGDAIWPVVTLIPAIWYVTGLVYQWNPDSQHNSLKTFKANKIVGAWIFFACLLTSILTSAFI